MVIRQIKCLSRFLHRLGLSDVPIHLLEHQLFQKQGANASEPRGGNENLIENGSGDLPFRLIAGIWCLDRPYCSSLLDFVTLQANQLFFPYASKLKHGYIVIEISGKSLLHGISNSVPYAV